MTEEEKELFLKKGYEMLEKANRFAEDLYSWDKFCSNYGDLEGEIVYDKRFNELNCKMKESVKRINL